MKYVIVQIENLRTTHDDTAMEPFEYEYDDGTRIIPMLFDYNIHSGIIDALQQLRGFKKKVKWALRYDTSTSRTRPEPIITTGYHKITMSQLLIELFEPTRNKPDMVRRSTKRIDDFVNTYPIIKEEWDDILDAELGVRIDLDVRTCWTLSAYARYVDQTVSSERVKRAVLKLVKEQKSAYPDFEGYGFNTAYWDVIPTGIIDLDAQQSTATPPSNNDEQIINNSDQQLLKLIEKQNELIDKFNQKFNRLIEDQNNLIKELQMKSS